MSHTARCTSGAPYATPSSATAGDGTRWVTPVAGGGQGARCICLTALGKPSCMRGHPPRHLRGQVRGGLFVSRRSRRACRRPLARKRACRGREASCACRLCRLASKRAPMSSTGSASPPTTALHCRVAASSGAPALRTAYSFGGTGLGAVRRVSVNAGSGASSRPTLQFPVY